MAHPEMDICKNLKKKISLRHKKDRIRRASFVRFLSALKTT